MYCHGAFELEHNRLTQFNLRALSKRERVPLMSKPATSCFLLDESCLILAGLRFQIKSNVILPILCASYSIAITNSVPELKLATLIHAALKMKAFLGVSVNH